MAVSDSRAPEGKEFGPVRSHKDLDKLMHDRYGKEVADALRNSTKDQKSAIEALHKAGLNGKSEEVMREYQTHLQEIDRKGDVQKKWYQKLGGAVKDVVKAPFRAVGWAFKKHPILTTLGLTVAAIVGGAYFTGNLEALLSRVGVAHLDAAGRAAAPGGSIFGGKINPEFMIEPMKNINDL